MKKPVKSNEFRSTCFLSLPHDFETVRNGLSNVIENIGGKSTYVIESEGDTLHNEITRGITKSSILVADLSSTDRPKSTKGPRLAIMWEIGMAEALQMNIILICRSKDKKYVPTILKNNHIVYYNINNISNMLSEVEKALVSIIARKKASTIKIFEAKCYSDRNSADLEIRYLKAKESIKILQLNLETVESQLNTIKTAMKNNLYLSVQILTLNPFSKFAEDRANQLAILPDIYRRKLYQKIEDSHNQLMEISNKRWELRIYDTFPTQIMYQIDNSLIHSIIALGKKSRSMLHYEIQNNQPNASLTFEAHFAQLWGLSEKYQDWLKKNKTAVKKLMEN